MTVVDTSVIVDYVNDNETYQALYLHNLLRSKAQVAATGTIRYELLRGFRLGRHYEQTKVFLMGFEFLPADGREFYDRSAERYRDLRRRGITIRKSADVLIASACIDAKLPLLTSDRDFLPFAEHHGLQLVGWQEPTPSAPTRGA